VFEEPIAMPRRPMPKSLESLHTTLQKLEQTSDLEAEGTSISELKQVVLNRIIDLELSKTLVTEDDECESSSGPTDLSPLPSIGEERGAEKASQPVLLEKLD
jgi:hypothetical protein